MANSQDVFIKLQTIRKLRGTNLKLQNIKELIDKSTWVEKLLNYTYNPAINFRVTWPEKPGKNIHGKNWTGAIFALLDQLNTGSISGNWAKELIQKHLNELNPESGMLLIWTLNRSLKIGLNVKTLNTVLYRKIPSFEVMKAEDYDPSRIKFPCWATVKIDGLRGKFIDGKFYSRRGIEYTGLDHLVWAFKTWEGPRDIDTELYIPDMEFNEMSGLIRSGAGGEQVHAYVLDLPTAPGTFEDRCKLIWGHPPRKFIKPLMNYLVLGQKSLDLCYSRVLAEGYEGLVIRPLDYEYQYKRSFSWMRMVPEKSKDLLVTDVYEGQKSFTGMLGGVVVQYGERTVKVGTGFSQEERVEYWENPESIIGQVIKVAYKNETHLGSLRQPRFKGIRPDKQGEADE